MSSRSRILDMVKANQPDLKELPELFPSWDADQSIVETFKTVLTVIGGTVVPLANLEEVASYISEQYGSKGRIISTLPELAPVTEAGWENKDPHEYENV
ncbi:MAG: lactate utilization protein B/C, partial [Pedobacter sp.]